MSDFTSLALASKVLYDRDILHARSELLRLKKATARKLFYHHIDDDLRQLNLHVIRCGCSKCLDLVAHNYPDDSTSMKDEASNGEVRFSLDHTDENFKGQLVLFREDDQGFWSRTWSDVETTLLRDKKGNARCALLEWFQKTCAELGLPHPTYQYGVRAFPLWVELGHQNGGGERGLGYSWRDRVWAMPYEEQVHKVYRGLQHDKLKTALAAVGVEPTVMDETDFERAFALNDVSLLP